MSRAQARTAGVVHRSAAAAHSGQFAADVAHYLTQSPRQLPSRYLYDALGSALFGAICELPWYRITRAEQRLLVAHGSEVFRWIAPVSTIVELGPGSGVKLRTLVEARAAASDTLDVHLVDVSPSALEVAARTLEPLERVRTFTHEMPYEAGLSEATAKIKTADRALVLFLGSNIGNFDSGASEAFLRAIRGSLRHRDALLLGTDLVKPEPELLIAYDDPLGVTAAFNRNLLVRINRELDGDFDVGQFAHEAVWNATESRIEMHLVSRRAQRIRVGAARLDLTMAEGERIWTESSYKYRPEDVARMLERAGFRLAAQWLDGQDQFALTLGEAV